MVDIADITPSALDATDKVLVRRNASTPFDLEAVDPADLGATTPLALWDFWKETLFATINTTAPDIFTGNAVASGTNSTAIPSASLAGYNNYGVFLRSNTTANGGYRYQTTSLVADYFGTIDHKFRAQILPRTSHTGRTIRLGYHDTTSTADAVDGAYFEIVDGVASCKTASNSTRTTDATTYSLTINTPYTFDIEVNTAGTEVRYRIYEGTTETAVLDETITTNIPTTSARAFGCGIIALESSTTASDICILYRMGFGTIAGFNRIYG